MHKTVDEALALVNAVKGPIAEIKGAESAVCVPFVSLAPLAEALKDSPIQLGAQNMYWEDEGAFTGEISPLMLKDFCDLVIIGHSERRGYFGETDETVNKKIKAALHHEITPIVCVGETLEQNEAGETEDFVSGQVRAALAGITPEQAKGIIIAYEPIWAIGTGKAATPEEANRIIGEVVRSTLVKIYGDAIAQLMRIQYGGSMKPANVEALMAQPEIDGGLVGGASLKSEDFITLVRVSAEMKAK
jgi:triosephosphate isomerase